MFDVNYNKEYFWISQRDILDNFRFFFTKAERNILSNPFTEKEIKQRLLVRTEAARISARSNFHIHRRTCRAKNHLLKNCRYI